MPPPVAAANRRGDRRPQADDAQREEQRSAQRNAQREARVARLRDAVHASLVTDAELTRRRAAYRHAEATLDDAALLAEFAFPLTQEGRRTPGVAESGVSRFSLMTLAEMDLAVSLVARGVTPSTAAAQAIGVMPGAFRAWLARGRDPLDPDTRYARFAQRIAQAVAVARAEAEGVVFEENPLAWLRMGPGGQTTREQDGWTERLVGADGFSAPEVVHRLRDERVARITALLEKTTRSEAETQSQIVDAVLVAADDDGDAPS